MASTSESEDDQFKVDLWKSEAGSELKRSLTGDPNLRSSTLCRLESRYGQGNDLKNRLLVISNLPFLYILPEVYLLSRSRVFQFLKEAQQLEKLRKTVNLVNLGRVIEFAGQVKLVEQSVQKACAPNLTEVSNSSTCANRSSAEVRSMAYLDLSTNSCIISKGAGALAIALNSAVNGSAFFSLIPKKVTIPLDQKLADTSALIQPSTSATIATVPRSHALVPAKSRALVPVEKPQVMPPSFDREHEIAPKVFNDFVSMPRVKSSQPESRLTHTFGAEYGGWSANGVFITGEMRSELQTIEELHLPEKLATLPRDSHIVSIGEGTDSMASVLAKSFPNTRAIDIWYGNQKLPKDLADFVSKNQKILIPGDVTKLPLPNDSQDLVLAHQLFNNLKRMDTKMDGFSEIIRVLKRGGEARINFRGGVKPEIIEELKSNFGTKTNLLIDDEVLIIKKVSN